MSCSDEGLNIIDGVLENVLGQSTCIAITSDVINIPNGTTTSWVFRSVSSIITNIDFSRAKNIENIGDYAFYSCSKLKNLNLTSCSKLTTLGYGAFQYCSQLETIILPNSPLDTILGGTFAYCTSLKTFTLPNNVQVLDDYVTESRGIFLSCKALKSFLFQPDSQCIKIGSKTFDSCGLESISLPPSIESINSWSFRICLDLKYIEVDSNNPFYKSVSGTLMTKTNQLVYVPNKAFDTKVLTIDSDVTSFGSSPFLGLNSYTSVIIPTTINTLPNQAFYSMTGLETITIPSTISSLGTQLFGMCSKLRNIIFECHVEKLSNSMFQQCIALENFSIPRGVVELGNSVFYRCTSLSYVFIPSTVEKFGNGVFTYTPQDIIIEFEEGSSFVEKDMYIYNPDLTYLIVYIGNSDSIQIIDSVTDISSGAFQSREIRTVTFQNEKNIASIGSYAFEGCSKLESITIPSNLKTINEYTFSSCSSLKQITIPQTLETIQQFAFDGCSSLETVIFDTESTLTTIDISAFEDCIKLSNLELPDSIVKFGDAAFKSCSSLHSIKLPSNIKEIGSNCFHSTNIDSISYENDKIALQTLSPLFAGNAEKLLTFVVPDSVETIEGSAFTNCLELKEVTFGKNLSSIENYAFSNCPKLRKIIIKENKKLEAISFQAFDKCDALREFDVNTYDNNFYFDNGMLFNNDKTEIVCFLRAASPFTITIPKTIKKIQQFAFSSCTSLREVIFEEIDQTDDADKDYGITFIALSGFQGCSLLQKINFPSTLTELGSNCFSNCDLRNINLASTHLTDIKDNTFSGNKKLKMISLPGTLKQVSKNSFTNVNSFASVVYIGTKEILNSAGFAKTAKALCFNDYPNDFFLGLPVTREIQLICTKEKPIYRIISYHMFFISLCFSFS